MIVDSKLKDQIIQAIAEGRLSDSDLRSINEVLVSRLKANSSVKNAAAKSKLEIGMKVKVNHPKLANREFVLTEIKRTKASVRPAGEMFSGYSVPLHLVESI